MKSAGEVSVEHRLEFAVCSGRPHLCQVYPEQNVKDPRIAVLYQNDEFGKAVLSGLKEGLGERQNTLADVVSYELTEYDGGFTGRQAEEQRRNRFRQPHHAEVCRESIRAVDNLAWEAALHPAQRIEFKSIWFDRRRSLLLGGRDIGFLCEAAVRPAMARLAGFQRGRHSWINIIRPDPRRTG